MRTTYLITYYDVHSFDTETSKRRAMKHARKCSRDHKGASVYVQGDRERGIIFGDLVASWDCRGCRIVTR